MDQQKVLNNVQKESLLVNQLLKNNFVEAELLIWVTIGGLKVNFYDLEKK